VAEPYAFRSFLTSSPSVGDASRSAATMTIFDGRRASPASNAKSQSLSSLSWIGLGTRCPRARMGPRPSGRREGVWAACGNVRSES